MGAPTAWVAARMGAANGRIATWRGAATGWIPAWMGSTTGWISAWMDAAEPIYVRRVQTRGTGDGPKHSLGRHDPRNATERDADGRRKVRQVPVGRQ